MKVNRILAFLSGGVALILVLLIYLEYIHMLGFPDGFITELGYAERTGLDIYRDQFDSILLLYLSSAVGFARENWKETIRCRALTNQITHEAEE